MKARTQSIRLQTQNARGIMIGSSPKKRLNSLQGLTKVEIGGFDVQDSPHPLHTLADLKGVLSKEEPAASLANESGRA